jgi:hypothetical protein
MRFAAVIRQEHAPAPSPQPMSHSVPDELTGDAQPTAPLPEEMPLDQRVRLVGEW